MEVDWEMRREEAGMGINGRRRKDATFIPLFWHRRVPSIPSVPLSDPFVIPSVRLKRGGRE